MPLLVRSEIHNLDKGGIPLKALIFKTNFDFCTNKMFFFPFVSFHMFNFIILHILLFSCPMKRNFNNHINLWRIIKRFQESPHDFCRSSKSLSWDDKSVIVQMPSERERKIWMKVKRKNKEKTINSTQYQLRMGDIEENERQLATAHQYIHSRVTVQVQIQAQKRFSFKFLNPDTQCRYTDNRLQEINI